MCVKCNKSQMTRSHKSFDPKERRMIWRHPDNTRNQKSNDAELEASATAKGVMWQMRSECWLLRSRNEHDGYLAIAAGSITNAFYVAHAKMVESGIENKSLIASRKVSQFTTKSNE